MESNYYVGGFGTLRFVATIGGQEVTADFETRVLFFLTAIGIIKEDVDWNLNQRIKGFRGSIKTPIENYGATTSAELVKLINMISNLVYTAGSGNKTITIIPSYSSDADAINEEFEASIKLNTNFGVLEELAKNVESVQYWQFEWQILNKITTLPTGVTLLSNTVLEGEFDGGEVDLTADDGEDLTEG